MKAQHQPKRSTKTTKAVSKLPTKSTSSALTSTKATSCSSAKGAAKSAANSNQVVEDEIDTSTTTNNALTSQNSYSNNNNLMTTPGMGMLNSYNLMGGMYGMGGGMFGGGMYGMGGMMGGGMITSYMFSLNQFLFGIQSLIFSLGQAVQIVGMNAEQMKSLVGSLKEMVENALGSVRGLDWDGVLDGLVVGENKKGERGWMLGQNDEDDERGNGYLSEEDIIKKRRLAAFRWTVTLTVSYVAYRTVRRLIRVLIFGGDSMMRPQQQYHNRGYMSQQQDGYRYSSQYGNQYGRRGGYYGGGYGSGMGGYGGMSQYDPYGGGGYY